MMLITALLLSLTNPITVPPILLGCNPPADLCDVMHKDCLAAGIDAERCEVISTGICAGSAFMAVTAANWTCNDEGLDCSALTKHANASLIGCSGELKCTDTDDLPLDDLFAVCLTYPSATGDDCEEPSAGQCMALLTLSEQFCDITTCEWVQCQREIMAQGSVCEEAPASCAKIEACDKAENGGGAPVDGPQVPGPGDWTPTPPSAANCLRVEEVFARPTGQVANRQWVKIKNTCARAIDPDRIVLRWTRDGLGWDNAGMALAGIDEIGPGMCVTVGGPESVKANFMPDLDLPISFAPTQLGDGATIAGVSLFTSGAALPFDAVAYGVGVASFPGPTGKPAVSVLTKMEMGHSLVRSKNGWKDSTMPTPNECVAPSVAANDDKAILCLPSEAVDPVTFCATHPWGRSAACGGSGPTAAQCEKMLEGFDGCGVTTCEFAACAAALATAPCGSTPPECVGISTCSN